MRMAVRTSRYMKKSVVFTGLVSHFHEVSTYVCMYVYIYIYIYIYMYNTYIHVDIYIYIYIYMIYTMR